MATPAAAPVVVASIAPTPLPSAARPSEPASDAASEKKQLKLLHRETPDFPPEALLSDVRRGKVKARLTLDEAGNVAGKQKHTGYVWQLLPNGVLPEYRP